MRINLPLMSTIQARDVPQQEPNVARTPLRIVWEEAQLRLLLDDLADDDVTPMVETIVGRHQAGHEREAAVLRCTLNVLEIQRADALQAAG